MKTYSAKPSEVARKWHLIDASEAPLGRIASVAAALLTGKGKPQFTKHIDSGDFVVIINTDKLVVTGNKLADKKYYRYSGYPSGLKEISLGDKLAKDSTSVLMHAVRGMLPVNKLRQERLARLKLYPGTEHAHEAQKPTKLTMKEQQ